MEEIITVNDVETVAKSVFSDDQIKVLDYQLNNYSAVKFGQLGSHQQLIINIQKNEAKNKEKISLFAKSITAKMKEQLDSINIKGIFAKEIYFYQKIEPDLMKYYNGEKWSAKCYLSKDNVLIMEDLRDQGFKVLGKFFDNTAVLKSGLSAIARFHAASILTEARLSDLCANPVTLDKHYPNAFEEVQLVRTGQAFAWFSAAVDIATNTAERLRYNPEKLRFAFEQIFDIMKPSDNHRNVICHGDLWTNNMMFDDTEPMPKCVLVDFQIIRYVPLVLDILQFVHLNSTRRYRQQFEKELIEWYYATLIEAINTNSNKTLNIKVPTIQEICRGLKDFRLFGAAIACLYFPTSLLDPAYMKENESTIFGDLKNATLAYMNKDDFFKIRIEEAVTELAEISEEL